jgi:hypothetical protein
LRLLRTGLTSPWVQRYCPSTTNSTLERFCLLWPTMALLLPAGQTSASCSASYSGGKHVGQAFPPDGACPSGGKA